MSRTLPEDIPLTVGRADPVGGRVVRPDGTTEHLTPAECELLVYLHLHPEEDLTRDRIMEEVLGHSARNVSRAVDSAVFRLRGKIESDPASPVQLITVTGVGYRWVPARIERPRGHLPPLRESVHGRHDARAVLDQGAGLTTVVGPPGVGKTTLALSWAHARQGRFTGGAWFASLVTARTGADCVQAVASALELPTAGDVDGVAERIGRALRGRGDALLVLDNAEQVRAPVASLVVAWREQAPDARLVVTSREPLGVDGEQVLPLGALDPEEAAALFVQRAIAVRGPWEPDGDERAAITRLCSALDGLPLAVELAAARAGALTVDAIHERLDRRLRLLAGARGGRPALREAIAWSWELLDAVEQAAFAQCAAFVGAFTARAAADVLVLPGEADVVEVLDRLQRRSLVARSAGVDGPRLWLYRSLRAFAEERLGQREDREEVLGRHARRLVDGWEERAPALLGPEAPALARALRADLPDLLAVADRARDTDPTLEARALVAATPGILRLGHLGIDERCMEAARHCEAVPPRLRSQLLGIASVALRSRGHFEEARAHLTEAVALARDLDEPVLLGARLSDRANLAVLEHRSAEAETWCRQAVEAYRRAGRPEREAVALGDLAVAVKLQGRLDEARQLYEQSLALHERTGNLLSRGLVLGNLAILEAESGRLDVARALFERAVALQERLENHRSRAVALGNLGQLADEQGDTDAAERFLRASLRLIAGTASLRQETLMRSNLGGLLARTGRPAEGRAELERALEQALRMGQLRDQGVVHTELAVAEWLDGDVAAARAELEAARRALSGRPSPRDEAVLDVWTGVIAEDHDDARSALDRAAEWSARRDPGLSAAVVLARAVREGDPEASAEALASEAADGPGALVRLLRRLLTDRL